MSTFTSASASALKIRAAMPGRSGTPVSVTRASVGGMGHACHEGSFHRLFFAERRGYRSPRRSSAARGCARRSCGRTRPSEAAARSRPRPPSRASPRTTRPAACARRGRSAGRPRRRRRRRCRSRRPRAPSAAASATAVVSEPPRPSVVTFARGRDSLEARDQHDVALVERRADAVGAHVEDARLRVRGVGDDAGLRARERDRLAAEVVDRHRAERARDALAGREQHVHLARLRLGRDLARHLHELVGGRAARRQHGDDAVALLLRAHDPPRRAYDLLGVGDGRAAELHDDDRLSVASVGHGDSG